MATGPKKLADLLQALRQFLGQNDMMAYLTMMAPRLVEMHRVLKPTGSIYLHCDPTASHYIRLLMDCAAKVYYILTRSNKTMTYEAIRSQAQDLGWKLSDEAIKEVAYFLEALGLVKKTPD